MKKAFTLIELLVVIAVIGLLASIILVNMKGTTYKAKVSKALQFSQSIHNALGVDAVGVWDFDEGSGTTARDGSGYGNNGTIYGAVYDCTDTPYHVVGSGSGKCALKFDGVDDYVKVPDADSLHLGVSDFSIEAWFKGRLVVGKAWGWPNTRGKGYVLYTRTTNPYIVLNYGDGTNKNYFGFSSINLIDDKWHHVVVSVDRDGYTKGFINGVQTNSVSNNVVGDMTVSNPLLIGKYGGLARGFIDELRIYNRALSIGEIQKLYAEGAARHQIAEK